MATKTTEAITILIPSKNRPGHLSALLTYLEKKNVANKIIILESGNSYQKIIKYYSNLNIELYEFEPNIPFGEKLRRGIELVKTPLVCLSSDDDLVIKDSIDQCAEFLISNPDYSSCQGYHVIFDQKLNHFIDLINFIWFHPSLESTDPINRLHTLITRYSPICWAVFKTEVFLKLAQQFNKVKTALFTELLWSSITALSGKVKRLPLIYCLRRRDELQPLGHPFFLFAECPNNFIKDYLLYRKCLEKELNNVANSEITRFLDLIHTAFFHEIFNYGTLRFIIQRIMNKPNLSILDPEIYNKIKDPYSNFVRQGCKIIKQNGRTYRLAAKFLKPEANEINLSKNFYLSILKELDLYPLVDSNHR